MQNRKIIYIGYETTEEKIDESTGLPTGIWDPTIVEKRYQAIITSHRWKLDNGASNMTTNSSYVCGNVISVLADSFIHQNVGQMTYVKMDGVKWCIASIDIAEPRINITLGSQFMKAEE